MPSKYHLRSFVENGFYHVFNRGVEKRSVFRDEEDYRVFCYFLKSAVTNPEIRSSSRRKNFFQEIKLCAFCLMPNHFHLIVQQTHDNMLPLFMRSFVSAYTRFFNQKYQRVGSIFQGRYKAKLIDTDAYLLHASRYIHLNPRGIIQNVDNYSYSSLKAYTKSEDAMISTTMIFDLLGAKDSIHGRKLYAKFLLQDSTYEAPF